MAWLDTDGKTVLDQSAGLGTPRPEQPGRCLDFDGLTQHIKSNTSTALQITGDITMVARVNPDTVSGFDRIVGCQGTGESLATNAIYGMYLDDGGVAYVHESGSGINQVIDFSSTVSAGTGIDIIMVRDASAKSVSLYLDGLFVETKTYTTAPAGGTSGSVYVGTFDNGSTSVNRFKGLISDVRIYDRTLTAAEALAYHTQGTSTGNKALVTGVPNDHLLGYYCDDNSTTTARNNGTLGTSYDGTIVNGATAMLHEGDDVPWDPQNLIGYSDGLLMQAVDVSSVTIRINESSNEISWGDGATEELTSAEVTHNYAVQGDYDIHFTAKNMSWFYCQNNDLVAFETHAAWPNLTRLWLYNNDLPALETHAEWAKLDQILLYDNNLTTLETHPEWIKLKHLRCANNNLASLETHSEWTLLSHLRCNHNNITTLETHAEWTGIFWFYCYNNNLATLKAHAEWTNINRLYCYSNNLPASEIDAILITLDAGGVSNGNLNYKTNPGSADASRSAAATTAKANLVAKGWTVTV